MSKCYQVDEGLRVVEKEAGGFQVLRSGFRVSEPGSLSEVEGLGYNFSCLEDAEAFVDKIKSFGMDTGWPMPLCDVESFLSEYYALCRKHGMSFGHEDTNGAFYLCPYGDGNIRWAMSARLWDRRDPFRGNSGQPLTQNGV
jgi:hypothetical protein